METRRKMKEQKLANLKSDAATLQEKLERAREKVIFCEVYASFEYKFAQQQMIDLDVTPTTNVSTATRHSVA